MADLNNAFVCIKKFRQSPELFLFSETSDVLLRCSLLTLDHSMLYL